MKSRRCSLLHLPQLYHPSNGADKRVADMLYPEKSESPFCLSALFELLRGAGDPRRQGEPGPNAGTRFFDRQYGPAF